MTAGGAGLVASRFAARCSAVTGLVVATYVIPSASTSPAAPATSHRSFRTAGLAIYEGPEFKRNSTEPAECLVRLATACTRLTTRHYRQPLAGRGKSAGRPPRDRLVLLSVAMRKSPRVARSRSPLAACAGGRPVRRFRLRGPCRAARLG